MRWWHSSGRGRDPATARDAAVVAIDRIRRDQAELDARIGTAFADAAALGRAVTDQRRLLDEAAGQIGDAAAAARAAAERAAADGDDVSAGGYRHAADGFEHQSRLVTATRAQLDRLAGDATADLERSRALLREAAAALDEALRTEVDLLGRLERLERAQVIAAARRRDERS